MQRSKRQRTASMRETSQRRTSRLQAAVRGPTAGSKAIEKHCNLERERQRSADVAALTILGNEGETEKILLFLRRARPPCRQSMSLLWSATAYLATSSYLCPYRGNHSFRSFSLEDPAQKSDSSAPRVIPNPDFIRQGPAFRLSKAPDFQAVTVVDAGYRVG